MSALREQVAVWILLAYFNNRDRFDLVGNRGRRMLISLVKIPRGLCVRWKNNQFSFLIERFSSPLDN